MLPQLICITKGHQMNNDYQLPNGNRVPDEHHNAVRQKLGYLKAERLKYDAVAVEIAYNGVLAEFKLAEKIQADLAEYEKRYLRLPNGKVVPDEHQSAVIAYFGSASSVSHSYLINAKLHDPIAIQEAYNSVK